MPRGWRIVGWLALAIAAVIAAVPAAGGPGEGGIRAVGAASFDRGAAWLGPRRWRALHTAGMYWLWFIFFVSFAPRAPTSPLYAVVTLGLLTALGLRIRYRPGVLSTLAARATAG